MKIELTEQEARAVLFYLNEGIIKKGPVFVPD